MRTDRYVHSGRRWADGAELVYGPLAAELLSLSPHPLTGRTVLDAGAGTGAVSAALVAQGASVLAVDYSAAMLTWDAAARPPAAVADIRALPLAANAVDDSVAAFVLNHLTDPGHGLAELARVTRPGGAVLATVFSNEGQSQVRDKVDALAREWGWQAPAWYTKLNATAVPLLGSEAAMAAAAQAAGLTDVHAEERQVDVGVAQPRQLVRYRLGHVVFTDWLDAIGPAQAQDFAAAAEQAVSGVMEPYRPAVVFLCALAPR
ncbi:MAG TPA: class I SAM-dependent methyltransferase [Streptosporangiaceae bacterium]|nr:class I SAM-dependent methyltransferase [Streptosporangiaceae bacterium]